MGGWSDDEIDAFLDWDTVDTAFDLEAYDEVLRRLQAGCPSIRWRLRFEEHDGGFGEEPVTYPVISMPVDHAVKAERILTLLEESGGRWPRGRVAAVNRLRKVRRTPPDGSDVYL